MIPEDSANREIANGFRLHPLRHPARIQIERVAGGWIPAQDTVLCEQGIADLRRFPLRRIVLLIDFDQRVDERRQRLADGLPFDVAKRVFMVGALSEPEVLRRALGLRYEEIGSRLAAECEGDAEATWQHDQLQHNLTELNRMRQDLRPILFGP